MPQHLIQRQPPFRVFLYAALQQQQQQKAQFVLNAMRRVLLLSLLLLLLLQEHCAQDTEGLLSLADTDEV